MLQATVTTNQGRTYTNLLSVIVRSGGHQLPEGTTHWGLRAVRRDPETGARTSRGGFTYPEPGHWATAPGPFDLSNNDACPWAEGDGLCLATNDIDDAQVDSSEALLWLSAPIWQGIASGGIPANHLLLVAYHSSDVLGHDERNGKLRVRRMFVKADIDGLALITAHGAGADVSGLDLQLEPAWSSEYLDKALMAGASFAEYTEAYRGGIGPMEYAAGREAGLTDREIRNLRPGQLTLLIELLDAGASAEEGREALAAGVDLYWYGRALEDRISHADIVDAHKRRGRRWDDYQWSIYVNGRWHGVSHDRSCAAANARIEAPGYDAVRRAGASDRRVRAADKAGINLFSYARALRARATHREIFKALAAGVGVTPYADLRLNGVNDALIHAAHHAGQDLMSLLRVPAFGDEPPF